MEKKSTRLEIGECAYFQFFMWFLTRNVNSVRWSSKCIYRKTKLRIVFANTTLICSPIVRKKKFAISFRTFLWKLNMLSTHAGSIWPFFLILLLLKRIACEQQPNKLKITIDRELFINSLQTVRKQMFASVIK